jgi:hypothetical protein
VHHSNRNEEEFKGTPKSKNRKCGSWVRLNHYFISLNKKLLVHVIETWVDEY